MILVSERFDQHNLEKQWQCEPVASRYREMFALIEWQMLFPDEAIAISKGKGCVKDITIELGGLMRVTLDRTGPHYRSIYRLRTSAERINSQAKSRRALNDHACATAARLRISTR